MNSLDKFGIVDLLDRVIMVPGSYPRLAIKSAFSIFYLFFLTVTTVFCQLSQRSSVFSNSGHTIVEQSGTSKIIGTLGQPFAGLITSPNDQVNQGVVATVPGAFVAEISVVIISTPRRGVAIAGSHPGNTSYLVGFDEPAEINLIAPDTVEESQFVTWIIDGTEKVPSPELSRTVSQDTEIIAVYETSISTEPGWNLLSIPVVPDTDTINAINAVTFAPMWEWDKVQFIAATTLAPGVGYWINVDANSDIKTTGTTPENPDLELVAGWNLVGLKDHQFMNQSDITNTLGNIWFWESRSQKYIPVDSSTLPSHEKGRLFPGRGYWIYHKE